MQHPRRHHVIYSKYDAGTVEILWRFIAMSVAFFWQSLYTIIFVLALNNKNVANVAVSKNLIVKSNTRLNKNEWINYERNISTIPSSLRYAILFLFLQVFVLTMTPWHSSLLKNISKTERHDRNVQEVRTQHNDSLFSLGAWGRSYKSMGHARWESIVGSVLTEEFSCLLCGPEVCALTLRRNHLLLRFNWNLMSVSCDFFFSDGRC